MSNIQVYGKDKTIKVHLNNKISGNPAKDGVTIENSTLKKSHKQEPKRHL